ncbi:MAG: hypothetical protein QM405_03735 [Euryarchaeota archaeon]|nr:hypothetical protein [Euryarchaeota archaeon]
MEKISLMVLVLWVAIGVSLSTLYIPVLSDSQEVLINTLNSATDHIIGIDMNFSLPLVSLVQGEFHKDYFEIYSNSGATLTNTGVPLTNTENKVKIPTSNLPTTVVTLKPSPTTHSKEPTNTPPTTGITDKHTSTQDTEKNSSIKKPNHNIPKYNLNYHKKYYRNHHQHQHPQKTSRGCKK